MVIIFQFTNIITSSYSTKKFIYELLKSIIKCIKLFDYKSKMNTNTKIFIMFDIDLLYLKHTSIVLVSSKYVAIMFNESYKTCYLFGIHV